MKVLVASQARSGVKNSLDAILPRLAQDDNLDVTYLSVPTNDVPSGCSAAPILSRRVIRTAEGIGPLFLAYHVLEFWRRAYRYIDRHGEKFDVIWLHNPRLYPLAPTAQDAVVTTFHSRLLARKAQYHDGLGTAYYRLAGAMERRGIRSRADSIFTVVGPEIADDLTALGVSDEQCAVIPNGVDTRLFAPPADRAAAKDRWDVANSTVFLVAGRLIPTKRPLAPLPVMERVQASFDDCVLLYAGDGRLASDLREAIASRDVDARLLGHVDYERMPSLYRAADYYLLPSETDPGGPLTLYEATASGLPSFVSELPSARFVAEHDCGAIVDFDRPDRTAEVILDWLAENDPARRANAREYALSALDWDRRVEAYHELLTRVGDARPVQ